MPTTSRKFLIARNKVGGKSELEFPEFPKSWAKLKDQPLPPEPVDVFAFLNVVKVSDEELARKKGPVKAMFTLP